MANVWLFSRLEYIERIIPPHEVDRPVKLERLTASLSERGWIGPPLIVLDRQALTGSHRLEAARQAGLRIVPVVELAELVNIDGDVIPVTLAREGIKEILSSLPAALRDHYDAFPSIRNGGK